MKCDFKSIRWLLNPTWNLPTFLCNSSDSSDSSERSDSSDSRDNSYSNDSSDKLNFVNKK